MVWEPAGTEWGNYRCRVADPEGYRRYGEMLARLACEHLGSSLFYYLDVPFDETVRRHATRPKAAAFGLEDMREWYRSRDLLATPGEKLIDESSSLDETVQLILTDSGLQ